METKAHHVFIGIFVLLMVGILLSSVFWLGRFSDRVSYSHYNIDFTEGASGLGRQSPVVINGIQVGVVEKVSLHPNDISKVRAIIAVDERIYVNTDTKASFSLVGVSGFAIELSGFEPSSDILLPTEGEELPTIIVRRSQVSQMMETLPNILRNVNVLIARIDDMISQNNATVGKSLASLEKGLNFIIDRTNEIDEILGDVKEITKNSVKVLEDTNKITSNITGITAEVERQITPTIKEATATIKQFKELAASLDEVINVEGNGIATAVRSSLENISDTAESFAKASRQFEVTMSSAGPGIKRFSNKGLKDTELLLKEAKDTLRSFNRLIQQIESNPQRFLFGDKKSPVYR